MKLLNCNTVFEDSDGYFFNEESDDKSIRKVRPVEVGLVKQISQRILIKKHVTSTENLNDEVIYFEQDIEFRIPSEVRYKTAFLFKCKSGNVMIRWLDSGCTFAVGINDFEFCDRTAHKAKKLPENTLIPKKSLVYVQNPDNGELELELDSEAVW